MKQYSTNLAKGKEIIEYYINELLSQGITNIPPWSESQARTSSTNPDESAAMATRRRLSAAATTAASQDASTIFSSSSPPKASALAMTTASNFSALSDELESMQINDPHQGNR